MLSLSQVEIAVLIQNYRFLSRVRQPGETVSAFVTALRRLARDCNFGDAMDCEIESFSALTKKMLDKPNLTYKHALELAKSAEQEAKRR